MTDLDLAGIALTLGEVARRTTSPDDGPEDEYPETDLNEVVRNSVEALKTLRDEIRVDLALAGKEARERWRRLESRLRAAETSVRSAVGRPSGLKRLVENARQFRDRMRDELAR